MKKILIIPHHPGSPYIKIRLIEIAKALSQKYMVYLVNWQAVQGRYTFSARVSLTLRDIFAKTKFYKEGALNIVEFPILHRPLRLAPDFNYFWLRRIIAKEKIDLVINGSYYMFNIPKIRDFQYIFDIADLPFEEQRTYFDRFIYKQIKTELEKADKITVASRGLVNYISRNYLKEAFFIPNGADIEKLRLVNQQAVDKIRQKYHLRGKWVIGYIGLIGSWVDVEFMVKAFRQLKREISNAALFVVGASSGINELRRKFGEEGVIFTGAIKEDIADYFNLLDIGVLPHKKNLFQDLAFHIKVIEYSAVKKFIVSTDLEETKLLNFPNLIFSEKDQIAWIEAIKRTKDMKWNEQWNSLVDDFDWGKISQEFINIICV